MNFRNLFILLICLLVGTAGSAQKLLRPFSTFSHKKVAHITLKDGTEIEGYIRGIDRKKGLIEKIKLKDMNGNKQFYHPDEIEHMYLPPSGFAKLTAAYGVMYENAVWDNPNLTQEYINAGYVYFEQAEVQVKNETKFLLMQLLNPNFSGRIKVFHDPRAKETTSVGFGRNTKEEGAAKSYFIKVGNDVTYKIKKKNYCEQFTELFENCSSMIDKYEDPDWLNLEAHVYEYSQKCER